MSSLIIEVCNVEAVRKHPNADRMCIVTVKGWDVIAGRNDKTGEMQFAPGDKCVYFPPETVIPHEISDRMGVTKYLTPMPKDEEGNRPEESRIRVARLRGEASYGLLMACEDEAWEVGLDVADHYRAYKYDPPPPCNGDIDRDHPAFHHYYDMENIKNFPTEVFSPGDEVVVTEKIHGMNCRLGLIRVADDRGNAVWRWMAGSHDVRWKEWSTPTKRHSAVALVERMVLDTPEVEVGQILDFKNGRFWRVDELIEEDEDREGEDRKLFRATRMTEEGEEVLIQSDFWKCFSPEVRNFLIEVSECGHDEPEGQPVNGGRNVVLFGERYGSGVQAGYGYGFDEGETSLRTFDVTVDRKYLDFDEKAELLEKHGVPMVPLLWRGPFAQEKIDELTEGPSLLSEGSQTEDDTVKVGREGVVVLSATERPVVCEARVFDRAQLKSINFAYLARKGGTEYH